MNIEEAIFLSETIEKFSIDDCDITKSLVLKSYTEGDFNRIIELIKVPDSFISKYLDKLDIKKLCKHQTLSEEFMTKHSDKLDWYYVSIKQQDNFSLDFIKTFILKLHLNKLKVLVDISNLNYYEYNKELDNYFKNYLEPLKLCYDESVIMNTAFLKRYEKELDWKLICKNQTLSISKIKKFSYRMDWAALSSRYLTNEIIYKFIDKLDINLLALHNKFNSQFIDRNIENVDFDVIGKYQRLSQWFVVRYEDELGFYNIMNYQKHLPREYRKYLVYKSGSLYDKVLFFFECITDLLFSSKR